jgi:hypothetical protein
MFFNADQTDSAVGSVIPEKAPSGQPEQNRNLSPDQFGKKAGPAEGGAAEGAGAAGGEAAAGGVAAEAAEALPLLLL